MRIFSVSEICIVCHQPVVCLCVCVREGKRERERERERALVDVREEAEIRRHVTRSLEFIAVWRYIFWNGCVFNGCKSAFLFIRM